MATRLVRETENYCAEIRLLQKLLQDTKQLFQDINSANFGGNLHHHHRRLHHYCYGTRVEFRNRRTILRVGLRVVDSFVGVRASHWR